MTTKLTLTIEQEVIRLAKVYAAQNGRSLSDLVETYLRMLAAGDTTDSDLSPRVKRLIGSVNLPSDFDYKEALKSAIEKKHG